MAQCELEADGSVLDECLDWSDAGMNASGFELNENLLISVEHSLNKNNFPLVFCPMHDHIVT
jgi:hypothetical protein